MAMIVLENFLIIKDNIMFKTYFNELKELLKELDSPEVYEEGKSFLELFYDEVEAGESLENEYELAFQSITDLIKEYKKKVQK